MDNYLNSLDILYEENVNNDDPCCNNMDNHFISHEKILCRVCGMDIDNISCLPEKSYENKNNSHHGMPVNELLPGTNLGSVVSGGHYKNYNMRLVQQVNNYTLMTYKDRSVLIVFNQISSCCKRHGINDKIIDEAKGIYKHISAKKISRGSNRLGIIASCVFLAAKNVGNPRSSKEISKVFGCDSKVVTKGIKTVNDIMRMHKLGARVKKDRVNYADLISRFCNNLDLNGKQIEGIHEISLRILTEHKLDLSSCTPSSLSASFIYYYIHINDINISKKEVSDNTSISVVTIQKVVNKLININKSETD
jgi:transcription initiation factor TFIIB